MTSTVYRSKGPLSWPLDQVLCDPLTQANFQRLANGAWVTVTDFQQLEYAGKVRLSAISKERLLLAVLFHVAEARWVQELHRKRAPVFVHLDRRIARRQDQICRELAQCAARAGELVRQAMATGAFCERSFVDRWVALGHTSPLPGYADAFDEIARAARQEPTTTRTTRTRGRPRVDWDCLFLAAARSYSASGGNPSLARNKYSGDYASPFMRMVDALNRLLPHEAQATSIQALGDRARNGPLRPHWTSLVSELRGGEKRARTTRNGAEFSPGIAAAQITS